MTTTQKNQIDLAYAVMYHMKQKGWTALDLSNQTGIRLQEIEAILRGEFDFGIVGQIQEEIEETLIVINKP